MDKTGIIIIVLILIAGAFFYFQSNPINIPNQYTQNTQVNTKQNNIQTTSKEFKRTIPLLVSPGQTFDVTYSTAKTGKWFLIIIDDTNGGCLFSNGKAEYKGVMFSDEGTTKTIQVTAPSSGSCSFTGSYNIEGDTLIKFGDQTVQIQ